MHMRVKRIHFVLLFVIVCELYVIVMPHEGVQLLRKEKIIEKYNTSYMLLESFRSHAVLGTRRV